MRVGMFVVLTNGERAAPPWGEDAALYLLL